MADDDVNTRNQCHALLEELLQDDSCEDMQRLNPKSTAAASMVDDDSLDSVHGGVQKDSASDDGAEDWAPTTLRGTHMRCCCGDRKGFNMRDALRDDMSGILVASGGRFPCLHIGLSGLRPTRRYFLALDFCQIASEFDGPGVLDYTEPYYVPRPNHCEGWQWMGNILHFNLNSIANGGLQEGAMTLRVGCEYEPTLRILELRDDQWPSGYSAIRFTLRETAFLVVSLTSEVRITKTALAREFLLVRKSEMTRGKLRVQECCRSPPSRSFLDHYSSATSTFQQHAAVGDRRRLPPVDHRTQNPARLFRSASIHSDPISSSSGVRVPPGLGKPIHDSFSGGIWKSLPQPQATAPAPIVPPPVWHSYVSSRPSTSSASNGHNELGSIFQSLQSSATRHPAEPCFPSRNVVVHSETRPSVPPFGSQTTSSVEWPSRNGTSPPMLRVNYDLVPNNYLQWVALARSNLARTQGVDHHGQTQQQQFQQFQQRQLSKQDMGVQATSPPSSLDEDCFEMGNNSGASGLQSMHFAS